jgi:hypothetical protein
MVIVREEETIHSFLENGAGLQRKAKVNEILPMSLVRLLSRVGAIGCGPFSEPLCEAPQRYKTGDSSIARKDRAAFCCFSSPFSCNLQHLLKK